MRKYLFFLLLLILPLSVFSQQSVFQYLEGEVSIKRMSGDLSDAKIGDTLNPGDSVITGADGFAELTMESSSRITIASETVFLFSSKEKQGEKKSIFMVVLGKIGFKFDRLLHEPDIETPATVAGIRGTEFTVVSALDGSAMYVVDEGSVAVEAQGSMVVLQTLEGVEVPIGQVPGEKFEVLHGNVDFSGWLSKGEKKFSEDPASVLSGFTSQLIKFASEAEKFHSMWDTSYQEILELRKELDKIENENGKEARGEFYNSRVFPKEVDTANMVLNYRYYGLSALSLRRYVVGTMYVDMKTRFILNTSAPDYKKFLEEYTRFLQIYEEKVVPYLVEADI